MTHHPSSCSSFEGQMAAVVNDFADQHVRDEVFSHIDSCAHCNQIYTLLTDAIALSSQQADPGPEFWDEYYAKLEGRLSAETIPAPIVQFSTLRRVARAPKWILQTAAAIAILLTGIWIGQSYFLKPVEPEMASKMPTTQLEDEALSYLDRTKTLLLGLANFNPDEDDPADLDIARRRTMAGGLIQEASFLKTELSKADQVRLSDLISDLEVILLQIANLESEFDIPEIEMVQNGVDRKAIFFKIDVENMLRAKDEPKTVSKPVQTKHSAI